jgi:excinuclease ABC subunit C
MLQEKTNVLKDFISKCPTAPGIYKFLGRDKQILYIGKAKNLRHRLRQYQNLRSSNKVMCPRTLAACSRLARIEITITENEVEALLLESHLIKKHAPKYNVLLKDGKSFPYICIEGGVPFPRLFKHRGDKVPGNTYYGPFISTQAINQLILMVQKLFALRTCTDSYFKSRTKPCVLYQLKRCSAPCTSYIEVAEYQTLVKHAKTLLSGKTAKLRKQLTQEMKQASKNMNYEHAAVCKARLHSLSLLSLMQRPSKGNNSIPS